ncbi:MAG: diaminobutyrate acetyltransferase [Amphiplicatus sp.]
MNVAAQYAPPLGGRNASLSFRRPAKADGEKIRRLIKSCPPLDENSLYCTFLQCTHFADSCVVAERSGEIVGWVSGYFLPDDPQTLFIWQVAVAPSARGLGLGKEMIVALLSAGGQQAGRLQTTITPSNKASWAVFASLARALNAPMSEEAFLDREADFNGRQETERLVTIGPFAAA